MRRFVIYYLLFMICLAASAQAADSAYLASSYNEDQKLCLYTSDDGINFTSLYLYTYTAEDPSTAVRDPDIIKVGDYYYCTFTTSTGGNDPTTIDIIRSSNLQTWTRIKQISFADVPNIETDGEPAVCFSCWAPQWFVDSDNSIHILATMRFDDGVHVNIFRPYEVHPLTSDFDGDWSNWAAITGDWSTGANAYDEEYSQHDIFIVKKSSIYCAFFGCPAQTSTHIGDMQYATSSSPFSGYATQGVLIDSDVFNVYEGPCVLQLLSGEYRLYTDKSTRQGIFYLDSSDLINWGELQETEWNTGIGDLTTQHPTVRRWRDALYEQEAGGYRARYTGGSRRARYE